MWTWNFFLLSMTLGCFLIVIILELDENPDIFIAFAFLLYSFVCFVNMKLTVFLEGWKKREYIIKPRALEVLQYIDNIVEILLLKQRW